MPKSLLCTHPLLKALFYSILGGLLMLASTHFPASANPTGVNPKISVRLSGGRTVVLVPFKNDRNPGLSGAQCGIVIEDRTLTVIGEGETEAYTCVGLVEAGALPPLAGRERIGLIYDVASPNVDFRTAAILVESSGRWAIDAASLGKYDDTPAAQSIEALADALHGGGD